MPEPDPAYLGAVVAVAAIVTVALRAAGCVVRSRLRDAPVMTFLGRHLPAGIMTVLVIYLLRDVPLGTPLAAAPTVLGAVTTVATHLWRRNALLSIAAGTLVYGVLLAVLPAP